MIVIAVALSKHPLPPTTPSTESESASEATSEASGYDTDEAGVDLDELLLGPDFHIVVRPLSALSAAPHRRYSRFKLRNVLSLMGCKPSHSESITEIIFTALASHASSSVEEDVPQCFVLTERQFFTVVRSALHRFRYSRPTHFRDFLVARDVVDRRTGLIVLMGGTSGCGKSTLAHLLATRLGITSVVGTDSVRNVLRTSHSASESPVLWASSYHAGDSFDLPSQEKKAVAGFQAQVDMLFNKLDHLIATYEARKEPLIVEGVHLSSDTMLELARRHPTVVPFIVYISNEAKHRERFAVRAKYMTLDSKHNRYAKFFRNIRSIQDYLVERSELLCVPRIDNTNVDRSVAIIHGTVCACLGLLSEGAPLLSDDGQKAIRVLRAYERNQQLSWSSKVMLRHIAGRKRIAEPLVDRSQGVAQGGGGGGEEGARYYFLQTSDGHASVDELG